MHEVKSHQPTGYRCPFCNIVSGGEDEGLIVLRNDAVVAVLALHQQVGNHGALLLFPVSHIESIYSVPEFVGAAPPRVRIVVAPIEQQPWGRR